MADLKISQLSAATALAGTEVVPVVQSGTTKKATIDQILAPASGKGINFSAAGGDTLTMYDEGTWTPTLTPSTSGSITLGASFNTAAYTRVGRCVTVTGQIIVDSVSSPVGSVVTMTLPFAVSASSEREMRFSGAMATGAFGVFTSTMFEGSEGVSLVNVLLDASTVAADTRFTFTFSYFA